MVLCFDCLFRWAVQDYQDAQEKRRAREDLELQRHDDVDGLDEVDGQLPPRPERRQQPMIYKLITFWAFFENVLLVLIMIFKKKQDYSDNYLHGFCEYGNCDDNEITLKALAWKLATSLGFFVGSHTVSFDFNH